MEMGFNLSVITFAACGLQIHSSFCLVQLNMWLILLLITEFGSVLKLNPVVPPDV